MLANAAVSVLQGALKAPAKRAVNELMVSLETRLRSVLATLLVAAAALALSAPAAMAGAANAHLAGASRTNPLAGIAWGHYTGPTDDLYPAYQAARGRDRALLAKIALRPNVFWFGDWYTTQQAKPYVQQYIAQYTQGNPNVLTQLAVFRMDPWEQDACSKTPSPAAQASYRAWIDNFAAGIGSSRVMLILQPDLPFSLCAPTRIPLQLVNYAARVFSRLPHTTVYLDAGAAYWPTPNQAAWMLQQAGIHFVRGFSLNDTQYDTTGDELEVGAKIIGALAGMGIHGKRMIVNTSQNGAAWVGHYDPAHPHTPACRWRYETNCATLGIPPTTDVTNPRWGLSARDRQIAARYADGYVWAGRPWLDNGSWPFDLNYALDMAASTPY